MSQNIQVATRPVEPHRTRLKIAPAGKEEGGREGRTGWQRSFCAGEPRCRSHSDRLRFCLRCCEVHRFSLLSFQLSLLPGRIQPRLRTKGTLVQWCHFFANGGTRLVTRKCVRGGKKNRCCLQVASDVAFRAFRLKACVCSPHTYSKLA